MVLESEKIMKFFLRIRNFFSEPENIFWFVALIVVGGLYIVFPTLANKFLDLF